MVDSIGNRLIEIDGFDLRNEAYNVSTRTGRYSMPGTRGENLTLPGASGKTFVPNKPFEVGVGVLACWVLGLTPGTSFTVPANMRARRQALEDNLAAIQRIFTRHHKLSTIRAAQPDLTTIRRAYVDWKEFGEPEIQADGTRAVFTIGYEIPAVWWEDESATQQTSSANSTLPKNLDLSSFTGMTGVIEDAVLTVAVTGTGSVSNPRITDVETGGWVQFTGSVSAGQSWVVDVGAATSQVGGVSQIANTTHGGGGYKLLSIPNIYGTTAYARLTLSGTNSGSPTSSLGISARRKWVSG